MNVLREPSTDGSNIIQTEVLPLFSSFQQNTELKLKMLILILKLIYCPPNIMIYTADCLPRRNMRDPMSDVAIMTNAFSSQTARIPTTRPVAP